MERPLTPTLPTPAPGPSPRLDQITTVFQDMGDPAKFVLTYAPAIRKYFFAIVHNHHDAEEAIQDFLAIQPERGRFRDYLKTAVRNAAITQLRQSSSAKRLHPRLARALESPESHETSERAWCDEWRRCVVERALRSLEDYQNRTQRNLAYTALRLVIEFPREDSKSLALRAGAVAGEPISPEAFRQQLSRARRVFARLLLTQAAETLQDPSPEKVEEELLDLGLMQYVRDFLPTDWRTSGTLPGFD
jgi:DNA-directed RNA polymerase specialized sigma24 family protein